MWQLALSDELVMTEDRVMAGEEEMIYALAVQSGIPHAWPEVHPLHCPACLNAHAITLLVARGAVDRLEAAKFVAATERRGLYALVTEVPDPELAPDTVTG